MPILPILGVPGREFADAIHADSRMISQLPGVKRGIDLGDLMLYDKGGNGWLLPFLARFWIARPRDV